MSQTLGFVGLGAMGAPMVRRLLGAGHRVLVHDVNMAAVAASVSKGAEGRTSPAAVATEAAVVLVSLPTPDVVRAVALGAGRARGRRAGPAVHRGRRRTGGRLARVEEPRPGADVSELASSPSNAAGVSEEGS